MTDEKVKESRDPLTKDEALLLLERFSEFASGMDDEVDEDVLRLKAFIEGKFGGVGTYTFQELQTTAPVGVYKPGIGGTVARLIVVKTNFGERAVLWAEVGAEYRELEPANRNTWENRVFEPVEEEVLKVSIEQVKKVVEEPAVTGTGGYAVRPPASWLFTAHTNAIVNGGALEEITSRRENG